MKSTKDHLSVKALCKRALHLCLLLTAGLLLSACKPEAKVDEGADLSGVYALISVNGKPVPTSVSHDGATLQVRSGTFTFNADGTCSTKTVFFPPAGSEVARESNATYTREGSKLTMQWKDAGTTTGTIEGATFTMNNEGMVFVYRK